MSKAAHGPVGFCPVHGLFSHELLPGFKWTGKITFKDIETHCPICDRVCPVLSGDYVRQDDHLNVLLDLSITPEAAAAIHKLANQVQSGDITLEIAKAEVEKVSPVAGKLFDVSSWGENSQAIILAAIIGASGAVVAAGTAATITGMFNRDRLTLSANSNQIKKRLKQSTTLTSPPVPRPKPKRRR